MAMAIRGGSNIEHEEIHIKVVVYWNIDKINIQKKYPVDKTKNKDYRYITLDQAIKYLMGIVGKYKDDPEVNLKLIQKTLDRLEKAKNQK
ncbi:MAG: hypothetical protein V4733_04050 [Verrucomicrobiota bacterium]